MARSRLVAELVGRAKAAGYTGLWLTVDTAVLGRRERDVRRGYDSSKIGPGPSSWHFASGWTLDFITNPPIMFASVVGHDGHDEDGTDPISLAEHVHSLTRHCRGTMCMVAFAVGWPHRAERFNVDGTQGAVNAGVEGIALSNHGGRQLDDALRPSNLLSQ